MTNKTVCAIERTCAQSAAAGPASPGQPACADTWLPANAEYGGRRHCHSGMAASPIFNH